MKKGIVFAVNVANVRSKLPPDCIYVGREAGKWPDTPLGNPNHLPHAASAAERIASVSAYADWFADTMKDFSTLAVANDQQAMFMNLAEATIINGSITLACWCAPKLCHAHVLQYEIMRLCGLPWATHLDQTPWALHLASLASPVAVEASTAMANARQEAITGANIMKYQVCRPLTPIEYEALKADIAENGVLVPVEVDENGEILDGHHRVQAWQELTAAGIALPTYPKMIRSGWSEEQKRNHARKLNVLRRQMTKEERKQIMVDMRRDGASYRAIAAAVGVDPKTAYNKTSTVEISTVQSLDGKERPATQQPKPAPPISLFFPGDAVALDPIAAEETVKEIRQERREEIREQRVDRINEIAKGNAPLAAPQRYPVIYADPPWRYEHSKTVSREIENQYPTMSLEEICALPVSDLAAPAAVLFLWTPAPKNAESIKVIEAWGFTYRTCMVWDKEHIGMGYYVRQQHELLHICTRGNIPVPEPANRPASVIRIARPAEHSVKPDDFYGWIERMYPEYDRIELFARRQRAGWDSWGNEATNGHAVVIEAIA